MNDIEFCRFESDFFGFGYGSGEEHFIKALKDFISLVPLDEGTYDYMELERNLGASVAWLLIAILCRNPIDKRLAKDCIIDYGTSTRFGWLTSYGKELKEYIDSKTSSNLLDVLGDYNAIDDPIYIVD